MSIITNIDKWKKTLLIIKRLIGIIYKVNYRLTIASIFLRILMALIPLFQIIVTKNLIDAISTEITVQSGEINQIYLQLLYQLLLTLASYALTSINTILDQQFFKHGSFQFEEMIVEKVTRLPLSHFDDSNSFDTMNRVATGSKGLELTNTLLTLIQAIVTFSSVIIILLSYSYIIIMSVVFGLIPISLIKFKIERMNYTHVIQHTHLSRKVSYLYNLMTARESAKEIRLFEIAEYLRGIWKQTYWENAKKELKLDRKTSTIQFGITTFNQVTGTVIIAFVVWIVLKGTYTLGDYMAISQAAMMSLSCISIISSSISSIYKYSLHARHFFDFIDQPDSETLNSDKKGFPKPLIKGISVNDLTFSYKNSNEPVLQKVSFEIKAGQKVAIVGENGSGKTTLVKCLLGLYHPTKGNIYYDGISIKDIDAGDLKKYVT